MENLSKLINGLLKEYEIIFSHPWFKYPSCSSMEDISRNLFKQIILFGETNVKIRRKRNSI